MSPSGPDAEAAVSVMERLQDMLIDRAARLHVEGFTTRRQPNQRNA